jgi:hypothetical protein
MLRTLIAVSAGLAMAACTTTQSTPPTYAGCTTYEQQVAQAPASVGAVAMLSPELAKIVGVMDAFPGRTETGLVSVQATLYNCSDMDLALQARTHFTSEAGQTEAPSAWKAVFLAPRGRNTYTETAISTKTNRVSVEVYDANRGQSQFVPGQTYIVPRMAPAPGGAP